MTIARLSFCLLTFLTVVPLVDAALVNIATNTLAGGSRLVFTSWGSPLPVGSMVRIGTFPTGVPVITPTITMATINAAFVPIGENTADANDGTNGPGVSFTSTVAGGGWGFTINNVENSDVRFGPGTRFYIMVLEVPPAQLNSATTALIMSDPVLWTIPSTGSRTMTTAQIDSADEVFYGIWAQTILRLQPRIPEPSTSLLTLLVGMGLMSRRRR